MGNKMRNEQITTIAVIAIINECWDTRGFVGNGDDDGEHININTR
jgi:hypothetical protein